MQNSPANLISYVRKIISSLAAQTLWGTSGFLWSQFILLLLSFLSSASEKDWELPNTIKTCCGVGRGDFRFLGVPGQMQQSRSPPQAELPLTFFRGLELPAEGLHFWQWYFSTFTKNLGDKRDQSSQSHRVSDASATTGKIITVQKMGTPKKPLCSAKYQD